MAHVNDKRLCAAVGQQLQRRLELIGTAVVEILDADVADFIIQHFAPCHLLRDNGTLHGQLLGGAVCLLDRDGHIGPLFAGNRTDNRARAVLFGRQISRTENVIALFDAGLRRRRIIVHERNANTRLGARHRNADAAALALTAHAVGFVVFRRNIRRPLVSQTGNIACRSVIRNIIRVQFTNVLVRHQPVDLTQLFPDLVGVPAGGNQADDCRYRACRSTHGQRYPQRDLSLPQFFHGLSSSTRKGRALHSPLLCNCVS